MSTLSNDDIKNIAMYINKGTMDESTPYKANLIAAMAVEFPMLLKAMDHVKISEQNLKDQRDNMLKIRGLYYV